MTFRVGRGYIPDTRRDHHDTGKGDLPRWTPTIVVIQHGNEWTVHASMGDVVRVRHFKYKRDAEQFAKDMILDPSIWLDDKLMKTVTRDHENVMPPSEHSIRFNINNRSYEITSRGKVIVLYLNDDPKRIIDVLTQLKVKISFLTMCEAQPMKWFDYNKTYGDIPPEFDKIELVPRGTRRGSAPPARAPGLPATYFSLRTEIDKATFNSVLKGTINVQCYVFGRSTYYERKSQKNEIVILELVEITHDNLHYYLYPSNADMKSIVEPIYQAPKNFDDVVKWLERSFGSSEWLVNAIKTGEWERVERVILSHNVFIPMENLNIIINEFKRYNFVKDISISSRFAREYQGLTAGTYSRGMK